MIVHGTDRHQRLVQVLEGPKWIVGVRETPPPKFKRPKENIRCQGAKGPYTGTRAQEGEVDGCQEAPVEKFRRMRDPSKG